MEYGYEVRLIDHIGFGPLNELSYFNLDDLGNWTYEWTVQNYSDEDLTYFGYNGSIGLFLRLGVF